VPRELYEFPGYAYPDAEMKEISGKGFDKFPPGHEVAEYIRMFADDMKLQQLISFETSVTRLEPIAGRDGWAMHHGKQGEPEVVEQFDFVVVATGMYSSDHVHLPEAEGMDRFQGQIMHSCEFKDASVCQGKSVVVVGGGKSSIDCVVAAANKGAKAASMVFRTAHWPVPRKLLNLVPFQVSRN
jgi:dimethylaniline monooxygenase (N-oxide forming)